MLLAQIRTIAHNVRVNLSIGISVRLFLHHLYFILHVHLRRTRLVAHHRGTTCILHLILLNCTFHFLVTHLRFIVTPLFVRRCQDRLRLPLHLCQPLHLPQPLAFALPLAHAVTDTAFAYGRGCGIGGTADVHGCRCVHEVCS